MLKLTENTFWSSSMDDAFKRARAYLKDHNLEESDYTLTQIEEHESYGCKLCIKHPKEEVPVSYTEKDLRNFFIAGNYLGKFEQSLVTDPFAKIPFVTYEGFEDYLKLMKNAKTKNLPSNRRFED